MIIVSDASALGNLAIVDYLWLLQALYGTVIIPDVVVQELRNATSPKIQAILSLDWVQIHSVTDQSMTNALQQEYNLDPSESHAIVLALEQQADELLLDERQGRQAAAQLGIPIIGILGVLLVAKQ